MRGTARLTEGAVAGFCPAMTKILIILASVLALSACANADGSRPRLQQPSAAGTSGGGYAGANAGFSNLNTKSAPF